MPILDMANYVNYVTLGIAVVGFVLLDVFLYRIFIRFFPRVSVVALEIGALVFWLFGLNVLAIIALGLLFVAIVCFYVANVSDARSLSGNNLKGKTAGITAFSKRKRPKGESLFDREAMYHKIEDAVFAMSDDKTGALITFEKEDNLDDIIVKSGTILDAPVGSELLQTIFYTGTRLHDGAVIVRNNMIVAASVYFKPTERPLAGKFGSRHRAAIGISEICDAVTVVVSEETGRVSIAYKGELIATTRENFFNQFSGYMAYTPSEKKS